MRTLATLKVSIRVHANNAYNYMKNKKILIFCIVAFIIIICFIISLCLEFQNNPNYGSICTAIATLGLVLAAVYGFYSNREIVRLQTSLEFCFKVYNVFQSKAFKERERRIQDGLMLYREHPCTIEDLPDEKLKKDIYNYCGYLDGIGVLVMEHLIRPEIVLSYAGVGILKTFYLLKPFLELSRKNRAEKSKNDILQGDIDFIITEAVSLYYANFELLALEMRRRGTNLTTDFKRKLHKARKKKRVLEW